MTGECKPGLVDWVLLALYAAGGRLPSRLHVYAILLIASHYLPRLREALEECSGS